ncbi:NAD(P)H-dependent glycerol-3-phosphate dehydrogenase [Aquibium sp. ELW1220]|uniref:NAD(P)H-dependent glycerol-3-phosphate dehydrogenase n=1 Tax=Aquibium sp. ELW1220 TaxID=2976766 RepID=UPI0025B07030|nr:NAD(P)H-dependent glycerol-3-phosphate dehydrogenase [Aquibium sp. ELW1220]MDN2582615.1 NAD(P)-dependent glycerol-3-phosphate dehydrogenase [Aquibium sp. ELW1220]
MRPAPQIAVLGGGAWGTALAQTLTVAGNRVRLWARDLATVDAVNGNHSNPRYLPGMALHPDLTACDDLAAAIGGAECVLSVVPAQTTAAVLLQVRSVIAPGIPLVLCAKGIEAGTGRLMSEIVQEVLPVNPPAALSGPSFASDVAAGLPTAVTVAAFDIETAARLAVFLSTPTLRCYSSDDLVGVEAGGALKNVLAIAAGAVVGAGLGASAQAALVTRGFVELRRIGASFGARPETLMGLSGLGDLMLTCGSGQSRNFAYGRAIGRGEQLDGLPLAEGVATAGVAWRIAQERGIDAPITESVAMILDRTITVREAVSNLLARPLKSES